MKVTNGTKVKIDIKEPEGYTKDLYNSIQGEVVRQSDNSFYHKDAYLISFGQGAKDKYGQTHNGKWSGISVLDAEMEWWTEREDFIIL